MEEDGNPLAEIGLALSMAFFSLMVLLLFAVTASPTQSSSQKLIENSQAETKLNQEPNFLIFDNGRIMDVNFQAVNLSSLDEERPLIVGVDPDLNTRALLTLMRSLDSFDVEIATLDQNWQAALRSKRKMN
jgi:hypothetical protein